MGGNKALMTPFLIIISLTSLYAFDASTAFGEPKEQDWWTLTRILSILVGTSLLVGVVVTAVCLAWPGCCCRCLGWCCCRGRRARRRLPGPKDRRLLGDEGGNSSWAAAAAAGRKGSHSLIFTAEQFASARESTH